jgi:hypothetical protein
LCHLVLTTLRAAPSQTNNQVDEHLDRICLKCLEMHADDRYADAATLRRDLERYLTELQAQGKLISPVRRWLGYGVRYASHQWRCHRRACLAALSATACLFVLAAITIGLQIRLEESRSEATQLQQELQTSKKLNLDDLLNEARQDGPFRRIVADAEQLSYQTDGKSLYTTACIYALAAGGIVAQGGTQQEAEGFTRRAIRMLQQADDAGFFYSEERKLHLFLDPDLAPLTGYADFESFRKRIRDRLESDNAQ